MINIGNSEILQIIEAVSREKNIPKDRLIDAMEQAIESAGKKKYGSDHHIKAEISRKNGDIKLFRVMDIVNTPENTFTEIALNDVLSVLPTAKIGDKYYDTLPPIDLGRVAAQAAKQVIVHQVSQAERERQYLDFKDRKGEIVSSVVKRIEFGNVIVDLGGRAEAIIKKDQLIKTETLKINDRIRTYVQDVRLENKGPQIFLSRVDDRMLAKLFELEVPEIYDAVIKIKAIARDPGSKSKVAVFCNDSSIDAVGSCVGIRGSRVRAITNELNGEKIDIVLWNENPVQFIINAMSPANISKIVLDEDNKKVDVVVASEQLSLAIGRRGQNVRLAAKLTGYSIDVMTEDQESKRRNDEFNSLTELYIKELDVEEMIAQLLSVEGYSSIEQIAATDVSVLAAIDGFNDELAEELKARSEDYVGKKNYEIISKLEQLGVEQELIDMLIYISPENILTLAEYGIKTIEDLAEITALEFKKLVPNTTLSDDEIENLINQAHNQN